MHRLANSNRTQRKPNRLPSACYCAPSTYFVTICCDRRRNLLSNASLARHLQVLLNDTSSKHSLRVHASCFMPDHFHGLFVPQNDSADLIAAVRNFKGASTAAARQLGVHRLWQKGFYDHILRADDSLNSVAWYILNPVRAGLVRSPMEWPFCSFSYPNWKVTPVSFDRYVPDWKNARPETEASRRTPERATRP